MDSCNPNSEARPGGPTHKADPLWSATADLAVDCLHGHLSAKGLFVEQSHEELAACARRAGDGLPAPALKRELLDRLSRQLPEGELLSHLPPGAQPSSGTGPQSLHPYWALPSGIRAFIAATGDHELLLGPCGDIPVVERLLNAMQHLWTRRRDPDTGLISGPGTFDSVEPLWNVDWNGHPPRLDLYPNLRICLELEKLLAFLPPDDPRTERWSLHAKALRQAIALHFGCGPDMPLAPRVGNASTFAPHANVLALFMGVATKGQASAILGRLDRQLAGERSEGAGVKSHPAYPPDTGPPPSPDWAWVLGCEHTRSCLQSAVWLAKAGQRETALALVRRVAERAVADGGFFEWYSADNCPQGRHQCRDAASLYLDARQLLRLYAPKPGKLRSRRPRANPRANARFGNWVNVRYESGLVGRDRRDTRRLPLELPARVRIPGHVFGRWIEATVRHPSRDGLCLQSEEPVPRGARIRLKVDTRALGGGDRVLLRGWVVWSQLRTCTRFRQCGVELVPGGRDVDPWKEMILKELIEYTRELE